VQKTRGLNLNHNHTLKNIFKGAATTVVSQLEKDPLHQDYQRVIAAGTKPNLAKVTIEPAITHGIGHEVALAEYPLQVRGSS